MCARPGHLIGLEKDGANVSLEPGGALGAGQAPPLETIHETCDEVNIHLREVKDIADEIGVGFIGLGAAPIWTHEEIPLMPKGRYRLMNDYMEKVGTMGRAMMRQHLHRSGQYRLRVRGRHGAESCAWRWPCSLWQRRCSPIRRSSKASPTARKAGAAISGGIWMTRALACLPFVFEDGFGFERYVQYALDVPKYFVYRDGQYINALGMSFRDFPATENCPRLPGETPTLSGLGRPPDHRLPRGADQEIHGNARR